MTRVLWIVGLSIALLMWGVLPLAGFVMLVHRHHRLTVHAVLNLAGFGVFAWMIIDYMLLKIGERTKTPLPGHDTPERI